MSDFTCLFGSQDEKPKLFARVIDQQSLELVLREMGFAAVDEVRHISDELRGTGNIVFEDGWLALRTGPAIIDFLLQKIIELDACVDFHDRERAAAIVKCASWNVKYQRLAASLREALDGRDDALVKALAE